MSSQQMTEAQLSHHSIPMEEDPENVNDEVALSEKPLSKFEKTLFALISG
jgi:hypothetical protein